MDDFISRQEAIDALIDRFADEDSPCIEYMVYWDHGMVIDTLKKVPSAQPEIKPIDYRDCADAMLKMWMDNVVTDGEYNRIMDKLNAHYGYTRHGGR